MSIIVFLSTRALSDVGCQLMINYGYWNQPWIIRRQSHATFDLNSVRIFTVKLIHKSTHIQCRNVNAEIYFISKVRRGRAVECLCGHWVSHAVFFSFEGEADTVITNSHTSWEVLYSAAYANILTVSPGRCNFSRIPTLWNPIPLQICVFTCCLTLLSGGTVTDHDNGGLQPPLKRESSRTVGFFCICCE